MKKIIIILLFVFTFLRIDAQSFKYIVVQTKDNVITNIVLCNVKMVFEGEEISFYSGKDIWTFDKEKVSQITFSCEEESKVEEIFASSNSPIEVYSANGQLVGRFNSKDDMEKHLNQGIYIVKSRDVILKRAIK